MRLLIRGARLYSAGRTRDGAIRLRRGRVSEVGAGPAARWGERVLDAAGYLALPGLINGHDHLGLNLFGRAGSPPYGDFYAWGRDIYRPDRSPLREVLRVPLADRLRWGGYRNLLGGATTVAHHDPYHTRVFGRGFPVRVVREYGWAHSLGLGHDVVGAYSRCRGRPFVIHALEGVNDIAAAELDGLDAAGVLASNTVLIHAIALRNGMVERVAAAGAAVVWCPASNRFLYGRTAPIPALRRNGVRLALGTDSTLSGSPTLLDEVRAAAATPGVAPREVLDLVTTGAAAVLGLRDGRGTLEPGAPADLVFIPDDGRPPADALLAAAPADLGLVLVGGWPRLASPEIADALDLGPPNVRIGGRLRWLAGRPAELKRRIAAAAGEAILRENPVWTLLQTELEP